MYSRCSISKLTYSLIQGKRAQIIYSIDAVWIQAPFSSEIWKLVTYDWTRYWSFISFLNVSYFNFQEQENRGNTELITRLREQVDSNSCHREDLERSLSEARRSCQQAEQRASNTADELKQVNIIAITHSPCHSQDSTHSPTEKFVTIGNFHSERCSYVSLLFTEIIHVEQDGRWDKVDQK